MSVTAILLPVFALVLLALAVLVRLGILRGLAVKAGIVDYHKAAIDDPTAWPVKVRQASNAFRNQFEVPILFYLLSMLVLATRKADIFYIVLAWVFVASRWVHAGIHCGPNTIGPRFTAFIVGVLALMAMWVQFALSILFPSNVP